MSANRLSILVLSFSRLRILTNLFNFSVVKIKQTPRMYLSNDRSIFC